MKKRFLAIFLLYLLLFSPAIASQDDINEEIKPEETSQEEVDLEMIQAVTVSTEEDDIPVITDLEPIEVHEKTLQEKLQDIYHLEVSQIDKPTYLMREIFTHKFDETSAWDNLHFGVGYNADMDFVFEDNNSFSSEYRFNVIAPLVEGNLKNDKADFRIMTRFSPRSSINALQYLFGDVYIGTNAIPNHRIQVGHFRPYAGVEGHLSPYTLPFLNRSQISRIFGNARKLGASISGNYDLIEYNLGGYSSDTFFQEFFPGTEFVGWANLKPLGKTNGKYGMLKLGGGLQSGHRNNNYTVTGAYVSYDYKRFMANFEYANANGYNGFQLHSTDKKATGFYTTLAYRVTPKIQVLARYDEFDPDKNVCNNTNREYSLGLNYYLKGQGLKLIFNYVFCQNEIKNDSHRLMLGTQIVL